MLDVLLAEICERLGSTSSSPNPTNSLIGRLKTFSDDYKKRLSLDVLAAQQDFGNITGDLQLSSGVVFGVYRGFVVKPISVINKNGSAIRFALIDSFGNIEVFENVPNNDSIMISNVGEYYFVVLGGVS